jgi:hypothetical protein
MTNEVAELKPLLLQLLSKMDAGFTELREDVAELKQDVAELSSNHFVVTGRLDEQRGILTDHLAKPIEQAHHP